jgi:hypothetical protein
VEVVQANLHNYVVAARFDPAIFAIYAVGCLQVPLVDVLTTSSANVMMVSMAADGGDRRAAGALALWHDTMRRLALDHPTGRRLPRGARAPGDDGAVHAAVPGQRAHLPALDLHLVLAIPCVDAVLRARAQTRFLLGLNVARLVMVVALIGWCPRRVRPVRRRAGDARRHGGDSRGGHRTHRQPDGRSSVGRAAMETAGRHDGLRTAGGGPAVWLVARAWPMPPFAALVSAAAIYGAVYAGLCLRLLGGARAPPVIPLSRTRLTRDTRDMCGIAGIVRWDGAPVAERNCARCAGR